MGHRQARSMPAIVTSDLGRKTLVLIGTNARLGFEAAKYFARMNSARFVLTARDEAREKQALTLFQADIEYSKAEPWIIDLTSFSSIVTFTDTTKRELDRLYIYVESAGMMAWKYEQVDEWKRTLHTKNLGPGLPNIRIIRKMLGTARKHSVTPRLVVVSSDMHYWTMIPQDVIVSLSILASSQTHSTAHKKSSIIDTTIPNCSTFSFPELYSHISPRSPSTLLLPGSVSPAPGLTALPRWGVCEQDERNIRPLRRRAAVSWSTPPLGP